jgi:PAS domain S-box-containing protein
MLQHLFDLTVDPMGALNFTGNVTLANPAFARTLGYPVQELLGTSFLNLVHAEDRAATATVIADPSASRSTAHLENRCRRRDGTWRWISWTTTLDVERAVIYLVGRDITEGKRFENEARRLNLELEEYVAQRTAELQTANRQLVLANQELEAFTYSVSHDLRAPLRRIGGFSEILLKNYAEVLDERGKHYMERVHASTRQMGELIEDLLKLSRLTRAEKRISRVDLSQMARQIVEGLRQAEPARVMTCTIDDAMVVEGDAHLLQVALENLLGNAWKFTQRHPTAHIEVGVLRTGQEPVYFVRDDGAGFDMAYVDKLFGPFQRLHTTEEFEGTGIGLATVQRIVHRHGGRVWAEGAPEHGATIYFTLQPGRENTA